MLESLARTDSKLARISATMRHMERHLDEKIGMDDLAPIAHMSRSAFQRAFREWLERDVRRAPDRSADQESRNGSTRILIQSPRS